MKEKLIFESVSKSAPSDEYAMAVYYLQKEVGLTYKDIFGGEKIITRQEKFPREGLIGRAVDWLFGERTVERQVKVREPAMNAKTFMVYLKMLEEDAERRERERKRQKMRKNLRGMGGGLGGKV